MVIKKELTLSDTVNIYNLLVKKKQYTIEESILTHYLQNKKFAVDELYKIKAIRYVNKIMIEDNKIENVSNELIEGAFNIISNSCLNSIPFNPPKEPKFTFVDLFAGIGGFRIAMQELGGRCVFSSEWDEHAKKTYFKNFGEIPFGDITQEEIKKFIPSNFDILCGGFPCQAFSIAGNQKGFEDTRGTLFFDIATVVSRHKPKVVFLENVKNLKTHDRGNTLNTILNTLFNLGYGVYYKILNASNYGVAQNRERIYIVCFRNDLGVSDFNFPLPIGKLVSVQDILEPNPNAKIINRNDIKLYKKFEPNTNIFGQIDLPNKPIQIGIVNKGGQGERIYSPLGHSCTLSAYGGGVGSKTGIYLINGILRKLSTRECARLQGFPDTFIINKNEGQAYKQFGNSVAVPVVKEIVKRIVKFI